MTGKSNPADQFLAKDLRLPRASPAAAVYERCTLSVNSNCTTTMLR